MSCGASGSSLALISSASANSAAARPKSPTAVRAAARFARRNSALLFVAAAIGVGDGLPGYVHSLAGAAERQQRISEVAASRWRHLPSAC